MGPNKQKREVGRMHCSGTGSSPSAAYVCAACLLVVQGPALAQSDSEKLESVRACIVVENDRARLACFDGVLADEAADARDASEGDRLPAAEQSPDPSREAGAAASIADEPAERQRRPARRTRDRAAEENVVRVTVVDVVIPRPGDARFLTEDGRVFVQTSGSGRINHPDVPFEATLEEGTFGSTFIRVSPESRLIRITERE